MPNVFANLEDGPYPLVIYSPGVAGWSQMSAFVAEHLGSTEKALVIFEGADHTIFMNACDVTRWFPEFTSPWVCSDAVWDMQEAHDLINHFTTAFLLSTLKDDAKAGVELSPEEVDFPGISYQMEGL